MSNDTTRQEQVAALMKAIREKDEDEALRLGANLLGDFLQDVKDIADALDEIDGTLRDSQNVLHEIKRG